MSRFLGGIYIYIYILLTNNLNNEILTQKKQQELGLNNLKNRKNKLLQQKENILTYLMNGTISEEIYKAKELQINQEVQALENSINETLTIDKNLQIQTKTIFYLIQNIYYIFKSSETTEKRENC